MNFDMKKLIKKILANPVILFNKIVIGLYLHIMKTKTNDIKKLSLSGDRILVLAPHQDDEMLGCGCFIQQALRQGNKVKCVFMTDGSKSPSDVDESTLIKTRKAEALKVAEKLKMELPEFLDMEDGALDVTAVYPMKELAAAAADRALEILKTGECSEDPRMKFSLCTQADIDKYKEYWGIK